MRNASRQVIIAANWKMYKTKEQAKDFCRSFLPLLLPDSPEAVIIPPSILIDAVAGELKGSGVKTGVQNIYWENEGAYTGEISGEMAADCGCSYCLCGHSERRQYFKENALIVAKKAEAARRWGMRPIICLGETLEQRKSGQTMNVLKNEIEALLAGISKPGEDIVFAYEPVWAIGTGAVAAPEDAEEAINYIRGLIGNLWGPVTQKISILYGGSVKPGNISQIMACPNIDGALVGGAGLKPDSFGMLVNYKKL